MEEYHAMIMQKYIRLGLMSAIVLGFWIHRFGINIKIVILNIDKNFVLYS